VTTPMLAEKPIDFLEAGADPHCAASATRLVDTRPNNGTSQVREVCAGCGVNVRGKAIYVAHSELAARGVNVESLRIVGDNRKVGTKAGAEVQESGLF
jgi:hypothetical protein